MKFFVHFEVNINLFCWRILLTKP